MQCIGVEQLILFSRHADREHIWQDLFHLYGSAHDSIPRHNGQFRRGVQVERALIVCSCKLFLYLSKNFNVADPQLAALEQEREMVKDGGHDDRPQRPPRRPPADNARDHRQGGLPRRRAAARPRRADGRLPVEGERRRAQPANPAGRRNRGPRAAVERDRRAPDAAADGDHRPRHDRRLSARAQLEERKAVAVALGAWISERYGVAVDLGMHKPDIHAGTDKRNFLSSGRTLPTFGGLDPPWLRPVPRRPRELVRSGRASSGEKSLPEIRSGLLPLHGRRACASQRRHAGSPARLVVMWSRWQRFGKGSLRHRRVR